MFKKKHKFEKIKPIVDAWNVPKQYHEPQKIYSIAIVLDNEVVDVLRAEERLWAMLMSQPALIDVTDLDHIPHIGWTYDEKTDEFGDPLIDESKE